MVVAGIGVGGVGRVGGIGSFPPFSSGYLPIERNSMGKLAVASGQRLYRPVFYYLVFWAVTLVTLHAILPSGSYEPLADLRVQLLWFLGVYVLVLAAVANLAVSNWGLFGPGLAFIVVMLGALGLARGCAAVNAR